MPESSSADPPSYPLEDSPPLEGPLPLQGLPSPDLPDEVHVALYRIAQEALNNVIKHAQARQAKVTLWSSRDRVALTISDDGRGFDPATVSPDHLGLGIIRERAQAIGAGLSIHSQPGAGTQVVVAWDATRST